MRTANAVISLGQATLSAHRPSQQQQQQQQQQQEEVIKVYVSYAIVVALCDGQPDELPGHHC